MTGAGPPQTAFARVPLLRAPNLATPHGFTTREGGASGGVYASLNLGLSTGDDPATVRENRARVVAALGGRVERVCALEQVHGAAVAVARPGWHEQRADASITNEPGLLLIIGVADCLPILFFDPVRRAVGAAHAGWRGTVAGVARNVVTALAEHYGSDPADLRVAFGPAIRGPCYQVGPEVREQFLEAGFPAEVVPPDPERRYRLDVAAANRAALLDAGVRLESIHDLALCTHCEPERFYSHRRDGRARGSHWALIGLGEA